MNRKSTINKLSLALVLAFAVQFGFAAFSLTGLSDERTKNNKYSLRNIKYLNNKSFSLSYHGMKYNYQYKGIQGNMNLGMSGNNGYELNSGLKFNNGNSTYILPYTFKVKISKLSSKFKTPSPANH